MNQATVQISKIYGEALFQAAKSADSVKAVWEDGRELFNAFEQHPKVINIFEAPNVPTEDKIELAEKVLVQDVNRLLRNFILMLLKRHRIDIMEQAFEYFTLLAEEDQGQRRGVFTSAIELSDEQKQKLVASIEKFLNKKLAARFRVDPSLIGGVTFKSGDLYIDNSLKSQLTKIRTRFDALKMAN